MTIPRDHAVIDRYIKALLVHFVRKHDVGLVRFQPLQSDSDLMHGMWYGVEFAGDSGTFRPEMIVSSLIVFRVEDWFYKHQVIDDENPAAGGFALAIDPGSGSQETIRKITPVTAFTDVGKQVEMIVSTLDSESVARDGLPVLSASPKDRLPLGLPYLWELAVAIELREAAREPDNGDFPVVKLVNAMLNAYGRSAPDDTMMWVVHNSVPDGDPDRFMAVVQHADGTIDVALNMLLPLHRYIIPRLKVMAGIDPFAAAPVENRVSMQTAAGEIPVMIRFEKSAGYDAVIIRRVVESA